MKLILIFILPPILTVSQTTVILKKTKKAIYVAADSRITYMKSRQTGLLTTEYTTDTNTMCKIYTKRKI